MTQARNVIDTILGEAAYGTRAQRYNDMLGIASVIANRAAATNTTPEQVVSAPGQFDAYGKSLPKGVEAYRGLAEQAAQHVAINGPLNNATFYATPSAAKNLPSGLQKVSETSGHQYFTDPQNRAIRTAVGYVRPVANAIANIPSAAVETLKTIAAPAQSVAAALRTAAFDPVASAASIPTPTPRPSVPGPGLAALAPNGLIGSGPLSAYNRTNLTPGVVGVLNALASNPAAATVSVNSGYRSPNRNAAVGGARHSQHMLGNAVDLNVRGLTDQQKASLLDTAIEAGAKGIGLYSSGNSIHVDARATPAVWSDSYAGIPVSAAPSWAQPALQDMMNAGPFAVTPRSAPPVPTARPSVPTPLAAAPAGTVTRAPLGPVQSPSLATMSPPSPLPAVPSGQVTRTPLGPVPDPVASLPAVPSGTVTRAPLDPIKAPMPAPSLPAALTSPELMGPAQTFANLPVQPSFVSSITPPVAPPVTPPVAPPVTVPKQVAPARNSFPSAPALRPSFSAMDVYNGRANVGLANDGSTVSRDQYGNVSVTNKYGATTTSLPNGQSAVSFNGPPSSFPTAPSISGPLGNTNAGITTKKDSSGMFGIEPAETETGNLARGFAGAMAGSAIGSVVGPVGSLVGAAIGKSIAQGRNPFDALTGGRGTFNVDTSKIGSILGQTFGPTTTFVAPRTGGRYSQFPAAPTSRGALGGTQSNRSYSSMRSISPGAASAISRGAGGLY